MSQSELIVQQPEPLLHSCFYLAPCYRLSSPSPMFPQVLPGMVGLKLQLHLFTPKSEETPPTPPPPPHLNFKKKMTLINPPVGTFGYLQQQKECSKYYSAGITSIV